MKAWLVTANDSFLWFPSQDDAEGYAQTLIADFAQSDSCFLTIDKYASLGYNFEALAGILYTSASESLERRLATYVWYYIKGKRLGSP